MSKKSRSQKGGEFVAKALGGKDEGSAKSSNQPFIGQESADKWFHEHGAIPIPYAPKQLVATFEKSNCLRQMVDAYAVNIYGTGWIIEPAIDIDAEGINQIISDAMWAESLDMWVTEGSVGDMPTEPEDKDVEDKTEAIRLQMKRETFVAEAFFKSCTSDQSFVSLCRLTGSDKEITGNAYWEILRDNSGRASKLEFMPSVQTRVCSIIRQPVMVNEKRWISPIHFEEIQEQKMFHKYLVEVDNDVVYFKEFGDPRVMSKQTGRVFETEKHMMKADGIRDNDSPATEVIHFKVPSVRSVYGIPRWIGVLLEIMGSRAAGEVNFDYFDQKAIPPAILMMSGGQLTSESKNVLQDFFSERVKGRKNFHSAVLLQGNPNIGPDGKASEVKLQIERLTSEINKEGHFQTYDDNNIGKIGATFRLPQLLRGVVKDVNKASAKATLQFAEEQVFGPERLDFDWIMNHKIISDMGLYLVKFKSNGIQTTDPLSITDMIAKISGVAGLSPNEARSLLSQVFKKQYPSSDEFWANQPLEITKLGILPSGMSPIMLDDEQDTALNSDKDDDIEQDKDTEQNSDDSSLSDAVNSLSDLIEGLKNTTAKVRQDDQLKISQQVDGMNIDGTIE